MIFCFVMADNSRIEQLEAILIADPNNQLSLYALGMEYSSEGLTHKALESYARLIEINPEYVNAYFMSAQTLNNAGRVDEARKMLEKGLECAQRNQNHHAESEMEAMLEDLA